MGGARDRFTHSVGVKVTVRCRVTVRVRPRETLASLEMRSRSQLTFSLGVELELAAGVSSRSTLGPQPGHSQATSGSAGNTVVEVRRSAWPG